MPLSNATKDEIRIQVREGIARAFEDVQLPPPDCNDRLEKVEKDVTNHEEFINGNGKPGAKTDIQLVTHAVEQMRKELDDFKNSINTKTWAIILLILGTLITEIITH